MNPWHCPNVALSWTVALKKAIREIGISWHHGAQFRASRKAFEDHGSIVRRDLRLTLNCYPIMPRDESLSDSRCIFFESGRTPIEGIIELIYIIMEGFVLRFEFNIISSHWPFVLLFWIQVDFHLFFQIKKNVLSQSILENWKGIGIYNY